MFRKLLFCALLLACASAQAQTALKVKVFPGAQALPLIAASSQGIFERHGLKVELLFTQNSVELRDDLANGNVQVVHAAVDNAVAMVERAKKDVVIVTGGDSSMNELFVLPEVRSVADLKGGILLVDAPNTAYALQAKKILLMNGLKQGADYSLKEAGGTMFRYKALRDFYPTLKESDWELDVAGQRVQIIKKDPTHGGILEFGTELVSAADHSIVAMLGASPGASTAVWIMIQVIERCFAEKLKAGGWSVKLKEVIPSYGQSLAENAALCQQVRAETATVLNINNIKEVTQ